MKVNIRFLKQGLIEAEAPIDYHLMTDSQKIAWANNKLEEKSDEELIEALSDYSLEDREKYNIMFDVTPPVEALELETDDEPEVTLQTKAWKQFCSDQEWCIED